MEELKVNPKISAVSSAADQEMKVSASNMVVGALSRKLASSMLWHNNVDLEGPSCTSTIDPEIN